MTQGVTRGGGFVHGTVLFNEVMEAIAPKPGGVYADVTVGGGGHARGLLRASEPDGVLLGVDRDEMALEATRARLGAVGARLVLVRGCMSMLPSILKAQGMGRLDGLVADLGVSSPQLDEAARGFSFVREGPLDMRMDQGNGPTALEYLQRITERDLADVLYRFGEERRSRPIARQIKQALHDQRLHSTSDLRRAVVRVKGPKRGHRDPATQTFQAIRIAVNGELDELDALLSCVPEVLRDGGVVAIISFHSLEDRRVKHAFREEGRLEACTKKPVTASDGELRDNPRSRSAKLRAARRLSREVAA